MELPPYYKLPPPATRRLCRNIVIEVAKAFRVPPGHITSHIKTQPVEEARQLVMRLMLAIGLKRQDLAVAFGRDLRRVRASVVSITLQQETMLSVAFPQTTGTCCLSSDVTWLAAPAPSIARASAPARTPAPAARCR